MTTATVSWAEVKRQVDDVDETCVVGLSHDARGLVTRLVWLRAPVVPSARVDAHAEVPDARPIFDRYSSALVASDFQTASACFTADAIYSHPPYGGRPQRARFLGRDALLQGLIHERGSNPSNT